MKIFIFGWSASECESLSGTISGILSLPVRSAGIAGTDDCIITDVTSDPPDDILELCDMLIFVDPPVRMRTLSIYRQYFRGLLRRSLINGKNPRDFLDSSLAEMVDFEKKRPELTEKLDKYDKKLVTVSSPSSRRALLKSLKQ